MADNRLRSGLEQPWMAVRIRVAKDAVLNSGEGRHPVPVGLRLTHDMPDFLTPAHQRIGDQGPMATPGDSLAARLLGPDLVLCMTDFLRVHNATDRRIVQAYGATDLGQTVAVLHVGMANGLIASCAVGTGTGSE